MKEMLPTRILLVDDHTLFRESLRRLLESDTRYQVVAEVASADAASRYAVSNPFDIALVDFDLGPASGGKNGIAVLRRLREIKADVPVLMITAGLKSSDILTVIRELRAGIFLKADPSAELHVALQRTLRGDIWLSSAIALSAIPGAAEEQGAEAGTQALDTRESEVLALIVEGMSNKEISARLNMPETTVKAILQKLFQKTGVRTRAQLVRFAFETQMRLPG